MDLEKKHSVNVEIGDFPFPHINGPQESRYLTWLRNHSNYMVEGGLTDYLRIVAVLVRGMVINFLILLPYFLVFAAILSLVHLYLSQPETVSFKLEPAAAQGGGGGSVRIETLTVTVRTNFGERDILISDFSRDDTAIQDSMKDLFLKLRDEPGQFKTLNWQRDCADADGGPECLQNNDDADIYSIRGTDTGNGGFVEISRTDLLNGEGQKELTSRSTLHFSAYMLGFATFCILMYPVVMRMTRVRRYKRALRTGHLSSVKRRDKFERVFGFLLFMIIVVAAFESFPRLSVWFNYLRQGEVAIAIPTLASMVAGLVAANQVLPMLGGLAKKIAVFVVGLLGLMIPLIVILFVVEFLVYTDKNAISNDNWDLYFIIALVALPILFAILLFATWTIGLRSFRLRGHLQLAGLFFSMIVLVAVVVGLAVYIDTFYSQYLFTFYVVAIAFEIGVYCWLAVDVNQTSINGLYRDRLASAYLIGEDTTGDIDIEQDIHLQEICNYDAGSTAPYHLINVALNLQATTDIGIRDRNSDFFMFSKRYIGSDRTGYCRSENMAAVYPQMDLGTAMAISAAAASPNMGRATNPLMVAFLTLLNIRLGYWIPHPDRLEKYLAIDKEAKKKPGKHLTFLGRVFPSELNEIAKRRHLVYAPGKPRPRATDPKLIDASNPEGVRRYPTAAHELVGIGFSGGGIRSATINLGMAQELHRRGVFNHIDYISSVSGGGYLSTSISTLMRQRVSPYAEVDGTVQLDDPEGHVITIKPDDPDIPDQIYAYTPGARLDPDVRKSGTKVKVGQRLLRRYGPDGRDKFVSLMDSFSWRVRPNALGREMLSKLDENHAWVNLSDGGHIENMASIELLRRRCKIIMIGDGECDKNLHFAGLATLVRYARIDLGIEISINVDKIRLGRDLPISQSHFAVGTITYPPDPIHGVDHPETGYLIYFKSSFTDDEDEVIKEYRDRNPNFPHESTADQMFDEGQFEAYRALGQHIVHSALPKKGDRDGKLDFAAFEGWIKSQDLPKPNALNIVGSESFERQSGKRPVDTVNVE